MKKIYLFLVCFLAFFMISCGEEKDPIKKVSSIESEDIVLMVGDTTNVELKYDKDAKVEFEWSSSDETIVTVSNGLLTALKEGNVEISVYEKNSGISTKIKVTVEKNDKDITELTTTYTAVLEDFVKTLPQETTENLPLLNDYNIVYVFETGISATGEITRNVENYEVKGKVQLVDSENNITLEKDYTVVIVGTFLDELAERFIGQFANGINGKMDVERKYDDFGGSYVRWESLSPEIFDNKGNLNRPFNNTYIEISYLVKSKEPEAEASYTSKVLVHGQSLAYKNALVEEWIKQAVPENSVLYPGDILPSECEDYKAKITWLDQNGQKADLAKLVVDPVLGNAVVFTVRVVYENSEDYLDFVMDYRVWNKKYQNDFEKIDDLINAIGGKDIRAYKYKSRGYDYENMGYVYFFENKDADINKTYYIDEVTHTYVRTGILKKSTEYVTIHDTAGGLPTHTAESFAQNQLQKNNNANMKASESISWHFTVGNDGIFQSLPLDEVAYHAGDGSREYGTIWTSGGYDDRIGGGNRNSIGIETCINNGSDYNDTLRILAKLVAELMIQYNLSIDRVKQHWHFSGKDCPAVIRHCNRWDEFLNLVKIEYFVKTELKGLELKWESLSKSLLDDFGKVKSFNGNFEVSYKVTAKYQNETKEYTFKANVVHEDTVYESL